MTLSSLVSNIFSTSLHDETTVTSITTDQTSTHASTNPIASQAAVDNGRRPTSSMQTQPKDRNRFPNWPKSWIMEDEEEEEELRPPYSHAMLAGGTGGMIGDLFMHSLDTVKTRQQGDPNIPPKYGSMSETYAKIFRQEGFRRGLYSGVTPAMLGSFPGTVIFFGTYEWAKRQLIDRQLLPAAVAYAAAGLIGDFAASFVYVPSEVLKTRLQLQGRYNNPYFYSGYNYRSTVDAARTIVRTEGLSALFYGYKATIMRDLPFSALQFTFYEQERRIAKKWVGSRDIGLGLEILTGMTAGGMAGIITCPLDVVKTRIQTQVNPEITLTYAREQSKGGMTPSAASTSSSGSQEQLAAHKPSPARPDARTAAVAHKAAAQQLRNIATGSPSTTTAKPGSMILDTSSVFTGLRLIYQHEGLAGCFRGVGPRAVWTSVQSGCMFVVYQQFLSLLERHPLEGSGEI